jgi:hypothetical protein
MPTVSSVGGLLGAVDGMPESRRRASCALPCRAVPKAMGRGDDGEAFRSGSSGELDEVDDVLAHQVMHPARSGRDAGRFHAFGAIAPRSTFSHFWIKPGKIHRFWPVDPASVSLKK